MFTLRMTVLAFALALTAPALAQARDQETDARQSTPDSPVYGGRALTTRGTIESVDRQTRTVLIKNEEGRISSLRVGKDVPGFDKLAKGARVTARYSEAMLISVGNTDAPPKPQVDTQTSQQDSGADTPSMREVQHTRVMGEITQIDSARNRVRLQTPKGEDILMAVPDARRMAGLKEGDKVVATYIEAFALAIEPEDGSDSAESGSSPAPR
ncbi:MAG: hypothetical protein IT532_18955 [Burkholderiales bacterium]|nr:hypothetical protein [Burkholderiales bacterium]